MKRKFIELSTVLLVLVFVFSDFIINCYAEGNNFPGDSSGCRGEVVGESYLGHACQDLSSGDASLVLAMGRRPKTTKEKAGETRKKALEAMEKERREKILKAQKEKEARQRKVEREIKMKRIAKERRQKAAQKERQRHLAERQREIGRQKTETIKKMYAQAKSLYRDKKYRESMAVFGAVIREARGFSEKYVNSADRYIEKARQNIQKLEEKKRAALIKQHQEELEQKRKEAAKQKELEKKEQSKLAKEQKRLEIQQKRLEAQKKKHQQKLLKEQKRLELKKRKETERRQVNLERQHQKELEQRQKEARKRQIELEKQRREEEKKRTTFVKQHQREPKEQRRAEEKKKIALEKQEEKEKLAEIKELYFEGKQLYKEGKYEEAIIAFQKVIELEGNPRILYTPHAQQYIEKCKQRIKEREERELKQIEREKQETRLKRMRQPRLEQEEIEKRQERAIKEEKLLKERKEEADRKAKREMAKVREKEIKRTKREIARTEAALKKEIALDEKEMMLEIKETQLLPEKEEVRREALPKTPLVKIPEIRKKLQTSVTADFKDVDLAYVLNFLSDSTQVNIIPGASVRAEERKVTLRIKDLPLESALKYILKNQGLSYRVEEDAVWVATLAEMQTEELQTKIYFLSQGSGLYAEFTDASIAMGTELGSVAQIEKVWTFRDTIEAAVDWPAGSRITLDERTSALIISNTPSNLQIIEEILYKIDISPVQVLIEARFIEVEMTDLIELGIEWKLTDDFKITTKKRTGGTKTEITEDSGVDWSVFSRQSEGFNLAFAGVLSHPQFKAVLHFLEATKKGKTLSAPKVTTMNNRQAIIKVVDEWRYPTRYDTEIALLDTDDTEGGEQEWAVVPIDFATRDIGIILRVTPNVGVNKDVISLALIPEISEGVQNYFEYTGGVKLPKFTSRSVSTNVIVNNGDTVVLGGLIKETEVVRVSKVPLLGDIPLLGFLFKKKTTDVVRKNLLIFVTANIITPSGAEFVEE